MSVRVGDYGCVIVWLLLFSSLLYCLIHRNRTADTGIKSIHFDCHFLNTFTQCSVTFKHPENQALLNKIISEVKGLNSHFLSQQIKGDHCTFFVCVSIKYLVRYRPLHSGDLLM